MTPKRSLAAMRAEAASISRPYVILAQKLEIVQNLYAGCAKQAGDVVRRRRGGVLKFES